MDGDGGDVKLKVWGLSTPGLSRQQLGDSDTLPFVNSVNSIVASTSPDINIVIRSDYHSRLLPDTSDKNLAREPKQPFIKKYFDSHCSIIMFRP